ncbi:hypothetical protein QVD17_18854 [Tagetes erecta]|uniref:Uncharacterized protein n=1 Tax=Tagetes erecta TaxID=13708 RepID=A0AAD8KPX4_TARER|nr:hypothetical protein QVD17_18854 [Tagetes erecta]
MLKCICDSRINFISLCLRANIVSQTSTLVTSTASSFSSFNWFSSLDRQVVNCWCQKNIQFSFSIHRKIFTDPANNKSLKPHSPLIDRRLS